MTFMDLCVAGEVSEDAIDDYVDQWHTLPAEADSYGSLSSFLGMTKKEYSRWVSSHSALTVIIKERKDAAARANRTKGRD